MEKMETYWERLKKHPVAYNITLIVGVILVLAVIAHITMQIGTRHDARRTVPDFTGINIDEAQHLARQNDLKLLVNDSLFVPGYAGGVILDQLPECNVEVKPGRTIYITINAYGQKMVPVPYVAGRSLRQAKNQLEIAGLGIAELVYREDMASNYVLEEYYNKRPVTQSSKLQAPVGSGITLYVGLGSHTMTTVPHLIGQSLQEAKSRLWELGLNVGQIDFDQGINLLNQKDARVYIQIPGPEHSAELGSKVDLRLTLNEKKINDNRTSSEKEAVKLAAERRQREKEHADSVAKGLVPDAADADAQNSDDTQSDNNQ